MKVILVFILIVAAIGGYFAFFDTDKPAIELTEEAKQLPLTNTDGTQQDALLEKQQGPTKGDVYAPVVNDSRSLLSVQKAAKNGSQPAMPNVQYADPADDIIGKYDPTAIAPEDESVQNVYDDAMQVTESDALAPEAGSEMMPSGEGNPMFAESIDGQDAPESMDGQNQ
ncbi:hypothetical protein [Aliiglaciecola litoralis]|uniref:Uncharacterized protein n=1 Tax=Aliiglaciecola litoralis TaxID=582857 RepID=A0ABP3WXZ8_9ALTE